MRWHFVVIGALLALGGSPLRADEPIRIVEVTPRLDFTKAVLFSVVAEADVPVSRVRIARRGEDGGTVASPH